MERLLLFGAASSVYNGPSNNFGTEEGHVMERIWNKVRFRIKEIACIGNYGLVVLSEEGGSRDVPIFLPCEAAGEVSLLMKGSDDANAGNEFLLVRGLTAAFGIIVEEVVITRVERGQYVAEAVFNECGRTEIVTVSVKEALLLTLDMRCPLFIEAELLEQQTMDGGEGIWSTPLNVLPEEMLQKMLDRAVEDEEYKLAQIFSEEIKRRHTG